MRVLSVWCALIGLSAASQLIDPGDIGTLLGRYIRNELTEEETQTLNNALKILEQTSARHADENESARSLATNNQARMSFVCLACRSAVGVIFQNVRNGQPPEEAADALIQLCAAIGIMSYSVCHGAVVLNTAPTRSNYPVKVAIFTDAHIDPLYEAFGVAECDAPTCCRKGQTSRTFSYRSNIDPTVGATFVKDNGEVKLNLSTASDSGPEGTLRSRSSAQKTPAPAGYWGDYRNCDTPIWAFDDAVEHIHENHNDIEMIYYMGDTIDHGVWETSYELINDMNKYLINKIRTTFGDKVLVIPTIGNHESQPTNQFAPSSITGEKLNTTWLYKALADKWDFYLTDDAKKSLMEQGDFSMVVKPGLRVISLNNNVAYKYNWWLVYDPVDSKKHLDWLIKELYEAELAGERVHILTHIPPGVADLTHTWTREYNRIINRFSETIAAEFNGHSHSDEFRVFYSPDGTPANVAWGAGSVTSYTYYNLNYKIATFEPHTFSPARIANYAYNLTEANLTPNRRPHWFMIYDMKNSFNLPDLSAQSMDSLVHSMVGGNSQLLHMYSAFYSKISDVRWPECDDNCKINILCKTVVTVLWEREKCDELTRLFFS